jgi:hypothetical protein
VTAPAPAPGRRLHGDPARCAGCDRVGPVWQDVAAGDVALCDSCEDAQARWDAYQWYLAHPGAGYPFDRGPPKSPPARGAAPEGRAG